MNRLAGFAALGLMLTSALVAQSSLNGTWQGTTPSGAPLTLSLVVKGTSLTGTVEREGTKATIENGKVTGNAFSFLVNIDGGTEGLSGEVNGDEMKMWRDQRGPSSAITLKRVKSA